MKLEDIKKRRKGMLYCGCCGKWITPKISTWCPKCFPDANVKKRYNIRE